MVPIASRGTAMSTASRRRSASIVTPAFNSRTSARSRSMLQKRTSALVPSPALASCSPILNERLAISSRSLKISCCRWATSSR